MNHQTPAPLQSKTTTHKNTWKLFLKGFHHAFEGVRYTVRSQFNMRIHLAVALLASLLGILLRLSALEFALIFIVIGGVLVAEMLNTAIEACVDLVSPAYQSLAKIAKDVAAGAVLLQACVAVIVGILIFGPHLWTLLSKFPASK